MESRLAGQRGAVILLAPDLWRVRLVVRTRPSQGRCTGSTPVRAAITRVSSATRAASAVVRGSQKSETGRFASPRATGNRGGTEEDKEPTQAFHQKRRQEPQQN